ncbi:flagellar hook assembly protein FlgD [Pseudomonas sp. NW5]|uniref:flagellar hook assembly protein FlgD n=1 Tax=Pseudomonas sp. NW5 TaxID=2934934 RepID=UPI002022797B|nr:flagellar hook assembly protein FlgD [Pseudomonas sp. NW5]MCL7462236.1 flagellar hook assembly protein FlgD [Pseudomonas sp. NW5]
MTTIDSNLISQINGVPPGQAAEQKTSEDLRSNFMTMLVTQLQNQDPLKPMENAELTSQLAQLNTLSGIEELNTTLKLITGQIDTAQTMQAAAMIGRGVLVPGNRILVGGEQATPFGIQLDSPADSVKVTITDGAGQVVRQYDLGELEAGVESFTWDATLDDGSIAPAGSYRVSVESSAGDKPVLSTLLAYGQVGGVSAGDSGPLLDLGATMGRVGLADIRQIL